MFESLHKWLSAQPESHFEHADDAKIHVALASLLYQNMDADLQSTPKEKKRFSQILNEEFQLKPEAVAELYEYVKINNSDIKSDLAIISEYLKDTPTVRMQFMDKLNQLIAIDGVQTNELEIFYEAMRSLFPEQAPDKNAF